jgi:hypothetical protein
MTTMINNANNVTFDTPGGNNPVSMLFEAGGYLASTAFGIADVLKFKGHTDLTMSHPLAGHPLPPDLAGSAPLTSPPSYLAGFAIDGRNDVGTIEADADPVHFKMHKDNPTVIPHQDMIVLELIGVALTAIPHLFH